ncbi:hypothetical protein HMPREF9148_02482 [Prevotella sp. F0091]|nr:hypothetical protein HMPREF9148_02482 [Prevotella sp. F0091]
MKQEKTSTRPSARWHASARPSTMLTAAVIAMTVLCFTACASSRKSVSRETATSQEANRLDVDSTVSVVETWRTPVKVPMSAVSLTLSLDSLRLLPLGAGYTARQGQANLKVRRKAPSTAKSGQSATEPGQIVIEASCDSLELVCSSLTKTVSTLKKRLARQQKVGEFKYEEKKNKSPFNTVLTAFKWLLIGFVTGLILSKIKAIILFIKRKIRI